MPIYPKRNLSKLGLVKYIHSYKLRKAISDHGKPDIENSDQGSKFTCPAWVDYLEKHEITISMDGKGRALDNIWIEQFWRTLKQEYVYICPAENGKILRKGVEKVHQLLQQSANASKFGQ